MLLMKNVTREITRRKNTSNESNIYEKNVTHISYKIELTRYAMLYVLPEPCDPAIAKALMSSLARNCGSLVWEKPITNGLPGAIMPVVNNHK